MKMKVFMIAIAFVSAITGCKAGVDSNNTVYANDNGKMTRSTRNVGQFEKITMIGSYDVEYRQGKACKVEVSAPLDIMDKVVTENKNGTLMVSSKKIAGVNVISNTKRNVKVYITAPSLNFIKVIGSGDFSAGKMTALATDKSFVLEVLGSGDIKIDNIETDAVKITLQGSGDIEIKNIDAKYNVTATLNGSGDIELNKITTKAFNPGVNGSGDISAHVDCMLLTATLNGTGDLKLSGKTGAYKKSKTGTGDYDDRELKYKAISLNQTQHGSGHAPGAIESMP